MEKLISIASSKNNLYEVDNFLQSIFSEYGIDKRMHFNIYLTLSEAINNAIQHGNQFDSTKFVNVYFLQSISSYEFIIEDEGSGFDITKVPDPTNNENIRKESGRGLFLMKTYTDSFEVMNNGRIVKLIFNKHCD